MVGSVLEPPIVVSWQLQLASIVFRDNNVIIIIIVMVVVAWNQHWVGFVTEGLAGWH